MAAPAAVLSILVNANTGSAVRGLVRVNQSLETTEKRTDKTKQALKTMAKAGAAIGAAGLVVGAQKSVKAAVDLEEQMNKTRVVFRGSEKDVLRWSKTTATSLGISRREALAAAGTFGNLMIPMGIARNEAAGMSRNFVKLAADLASFNNASPVDTLEALRSALSGETEPMRRFGADVRVAALEQFALSRGIKTSWSEMSNAQKTMLLYQKVLKDTKDAQGDFGRTSGSMANQQRVLKAQFDDIAAKLGGKLIPHLTKAMTWLTKFITQMEEERGAGGKFRHTIEDIAKAIEWLITAIGDVIAWLDKWGKKLRNAFFDTWKAVKKATGDAIAFILRRVADLFEVMAKIPIIGKKFRGVAEDINRAADKVDKLGENIDKLPIRKTLRLRVKLAMEDLSGVPRLQDLSGGPSGGPPSTRQMMDGIETGAKSKTRKWLLANMDKIAPLLGAPGSAKGSLGVAERIGHQFGLTTTSGYRPGDDGWHGQNRARDLAGPAGAMMSYARALFNRMGSRLLELIYTPMGVGIKNGKPVNIQSFYGSAVAADHYDHVHVAMQRGGGVGGTGSGDKVPALLEPGEFVMNRKATKAARPLLSALNSAIPRFQTGGAVSQWGQGISGGELPSLLAAIWQHAKPMLGATGPVPRFLRGVTKGSGNYAEWRPGTGTVHFSRAMGRALANPKSGNHNYALQTIFHELAHAWQDFGLTRREREGGADVWAGWAGPQILSKLGIRGSTAPYGYPAEANWVFKNRSRNWWQTQQFRGTRRGMAAGAAPGPLVARAAHAAGFRGANLLRAVAEAGGESGWNERAVGDGGWSKGLMQIYTKVHGWARSMNLFDPFVNMRAAKRIYDSQGWGAWHADHTPWISRARAAIAAMRSGRGGRGGGGGGGGRSAPFNTAPFAPGSGGVFGWGQETPFGSMPTSPLRQRIIDRHQRHVNRPNSVAARSEFFQNMFQTLSDRQGMGQALAALTPDKADDIRVAQEALASWTNWLEIAKQNNDTAAITSAAQNVKQWSDELASLTDATEEQNDLIQQQIAAQEAHTAAVTELKDQQKRNEALILSQSGALTAALIQTVNGGIGGNAGLGRQFPSSTGLGGLSRA
jgi:hypothetical protein